MADDGYQGYDIDDNGSVIEYYDHRDEFQPAAVIEKLPEKGLKIIFISGFISICRRLLFLLYWLF